MSTGERVRLHAGKVLKIEGPASLMVVSGSIEVLGRRLKSRERLVVPKAKSMSVFALTASDVEIRIGEGGKVEEYEAPPIPPSWSAASERILAKDKPVIAIVFGDVDSGKTTFSVYLANRSISRGFGTAVIDNDLGQSDIGMPTTIGMGFMSDTVPSLSKVKAESCFLVGTTSPANFMHRALIGAKLLLDRALKGGAEVVVVNTDGWVNGWKARELKIGLVMLLRPNVIVAIHRGGEVEHLIRPFEEQGWVEVIRLDAPPGIRPRTLSERRMLRESSYRRYFRNAKVKTFSLSRVGLIYSILGSGVPLDEARMQELSEMIGGARVIYAEESPDALLVILDRHVDCEEIAKKIEEIIGKEVVLRTRGFEKGLLAALHDRNGDFIGMGMIEEIDCRRRQIRILTEVDETEQVGLLCIGQLKLDEEFGEKAKIDGWPL